MAYLLGWGAEDFDAPDHGEGRGYAFSDMVCWLFGIKKRVPHQIEKWTSEELAAQPDDQPEVDPEGALNERPGLIRRMAEEIQVTRFRGTPELTRSNLLVAGRYIDELLERSTVRKVDRPRVFYKVRALVFTRMANEREGDQILNSRAAQKEHFAGTGWGYLGWVGWLPLLKSRAVTAQ